MITFDEYRRHDGIGLAQKIAAGDFSREEVLQAALARLDAVNPGLNLLAQDLRSHAQAQLNSRTNHVGINRLQYHIGTHMRVNKGFVDFRTTGKCGIIGNDRIFGQIGDFRFAFLRQRMIHGEQ